MITLENDSHVFFIRMGNKNQKEYTDKFIKGGKVAIGYDVEAPTKYYLKVCHAFSSNLDPEDENVKIEWFDKWKDFTQCNSLSSNGKTALRRFALARSGKDYFCTFHDGLFYWGTPTTEVYGILESDFSEEGKFDESRRITEADFPEEDTGKSDKTREPEFRFRDIDWQCQVNGEDVREGEVSAIIAKVRMMQATLSKFSEDDKYAQRTVFDKTINGKTLDVVVDMVHELEKPVPDDDEMRAYMMDMIANLSPSSFEAFVDLLFTAHGCKRCSLLGGNQIAYDMEYITPSGDERIFVQVKSVISESQLEKVIETLDQRLPDSCMCFIVHHNANSKLIRSIQGKHVIFSVMGIEWLMTKVNKTPALFVFLCNEIAGWKFTKEHFETLTSWK